MNKQVLKKAVYAIKDSLEVLGEQRHPGIEDFPKDCCFVAACVFLFLAEEYTAEPFHLFWGHNDSLGSHIWCENEKYIVDITAHQYAGVGAEKCFVEKEKKDEFHDSFSMIEDVSSLSVTDIGDGAWKDSILALRKIVKERLDSKGFAVGRI